MQEVTKQVIERLIEEKEEPCISIYMPTRAAASSEAKKMSIQFKSLLNFVKKELLESRNMDSRDTEELLKPATSLIGDLVFWKNQKEGLAVFISPKQFSYFRVKSPLPEKAIVSQYFYIIPLIPEVMFNEYYYVLTLSKNQNSIFRCTKGSIEKIEIEDIPKSLKEISKFKESEKILSFHTSGSDASGAIFHGMGESDTEKKNELLQYFRQIDQGLNKYLDKKSKSPLLIMSVKELFPIYREINSYPYLLEENIEGNPDEVTPDVILKNAWEIVAKYFNRKLDDIIETYHNWKGTGKTSTQLEDIVSASYFSRVEQLLIKNNVTQFGNFDPEENHVYLAEDGNGQYDLYNFAAIKTISNGGQVYVLDDEHMPDGESIIALYRF